MIKKCYRYFGGLLKRQEQWLNRMAAAGWRLTEAGKLCYTFESCAPGAYEYRVEFAGQMSYGKSKDYRAFLEGLGYEVFYKNVNLNWSVGKAVWRPWGQGAGQVSTSPGSFNKELMLVGRQAEASPFELHTTPEDKAKYMGVLARAYLYRAAALLALGIFLGVFGSSNRLPEAGLSVGRMIGGGLLAGLGLWMLWRAYRCGREARLYREEAGLGG